MHNGSIGQPPSQGHISRGETRPEKRLSQEQTRPAKPSQERSRSSQTEVKVIIADSLTEAERAAYKPHSEMEQVVAMGNGGLSEPRQAEVKMPEQQLTSTALDQREKTNGLVVRLQGYLSDILEAEDQLQPDTSGAQSTTAARYFQVEDGADIEKPIMQPQVQTQLDLSLQKVVNNGRFANIDVDQLGRIIKLCENVISAASSADFTIDEDTHQELDDWTRRIALGEQALYACRSLLRIVTAGREEKQLYSEDTLRNLLNLISHVVEDCIIPIVEMRSDAGNAFKVASSQHKVLLQILRQCTRVLRLLGALLLKTDVDESAITTAEYICKTLVFVENATSEKEAALGVQQFETLRLAAMDVLAKIFARYTEQRQFIFDEILTSLEKLPVSRQSARQFKMVDAKPIQLVSALLMRLVQTSATRPQARDQKRIGKSENDELEDSEADADAESDSESESDDDSPIMKRSKKQSKRSLGAEDDISSLAGPLYDASFKDARYMVDYLLQRAMTSTKTGDQPYRNLLDIFTEDFLSVLGNTDWPAAEMLLRALLLRLLEISDSKTSAAPAKSMALELMGSMATRITALRLQAQQMAKHTQPDESDFTSKLVDLHEAMLANELEEIDLLAFDGPYRAVLAYVQLRGDDDPQLQTAIGYHVMQWAKQIMSIKQSTSSTREIGVRLAHMIKDSHWLENEYTFPRVSTEDGRFASVLITLNMSFCRGFNRIFTKLLSSMAGDQASLRSKSLKSIEQLLEMDPSVLDRTPFVMATITKCLADTSPQVRDSALGLTSKCLSLRPRLDSEVYERIVVRLADNNIHVRKRAMKMLKDIYLRNDALTLKSRVADSLVSRVTDNDEGVVELARHIFEDIWITPFCSMSGSDGENVKLKLRLQEQTALIVKIAHKSDNADTVLAELVQGVLSPEKSKTASANFVVCGQMVKAMFEAIIDPAELPGSPSQQSVLHTLTIFAKASAKLFTPDQLKTLQPYVKNLSNQDNLVVYRSAIVILRYTLPHIRNLDKDFLANIQNSLIGSVQKLPKPELKEVAACLWMLDGELKNTERLIRLTVSVLGGIKQVGKGPIDDATGNKVRRLINIAGAFVKSFNLDSDLDLKEGSMFRKQFPEYKGRSVAALAVNYICPFTSPKQNQELREVALDGVSMICQAWPDQLMRADVCSAFELCFESDNRDLELILVSGLKEFFAAGDKPGGTNSDVQIGTGIEAGEERLGNTYVATARDGAATSIAQRFLQSILRVALASVDNLAWTAAQVIASINRQGLVHPKESGPCFVALETCPDNKIANVAFQEHRTLYHKHETMFEKEHMRSVQQAFDYQHDVIHDTLGYAGSPPTAKLHMFWEVLKTGTAKARKKFLTSICTKMNFEAAKLDLTGQLPAHVDMTRFISENLAFFDYGKLDELQHLVAGLEKAVSDTGTGISHAIEIEVLRLNIEHQQAQAMHLTAGADPTQLPPEPRVFPSIDPVRLRQLTIYSQILLLIWELRTYLRRLWNLSKQAATRGRPAAAGKDNAIRAPQRIPNSTNLTEKFLARNAEIIAALETPEKQRGLCASFAELMAVDNELKVADEDEAMLDTSMTMTGVAANGDGYETPSESVRSGSVGPGPGSAGAKRGRKRKSLGDSRSNTATPRKKKGLVRRQSQTQFEDEEDHWD